MKIVNKFFYIIMVSVVLMFLVSCKASSRKAMSLGGSYDTKIKVIKFMRSVGNSPSNIDKGTFWSHKENHAIYNLPDSFYLLESIETFPKTDEKDFGELAYVFLVDSKKRIDTIYADRHLKVWNFVIDGKSRYYTDTNELALSLRQHYSFFRECW